MHLNKLVLCHQLLSTTLATHSVWQLLRAHSKLLEKFQGVNLVGFVVEPEKESRSTLNLSSFQLCGWNCQCLCS